MNPVEYSNLLRAGSAVKRCHTVRTLQTQTVGAHSAALAMLVLAVRPSASAALLRAALLHDMHEQATGDIPANVKWENPTLAATLSTIEDRWESENDCAYSLDPDEFHVLRVCDALELLLFCVDEITLGNRFVVPMLQRITAHITKLNNEKPIGQAAHDIGRAALQDARDILGDGVDI